MSTSSMRKTEMFAVCRISPVLIMILLCFSPCISAASWYRVEVIVFDRPYPGAEGEKWRNEPLSLPDNLVELKSAGFSTAEKNLIAYMILGKNHHHLAGIRDKLTFSNGYRLLTHIAWQQPAFRGSRSPYVRLQVLSNDRESTAVPESTWQYAMSGRVIDGSIRIRSGFYLYADVHLFYSRQLPPEQKIIRTDRETFAGTETEKTIMKLKETRRIKLNEIHYFDHPMYGVILRVSRL